MEGKQTNLHSYECCAWARSYFEFMRFGFAQCKMGCGNNNLKKNSLQQFKEKNNYELVHFLEPWAYSLKLWSMNYELNLSDELELVHVESELSQHWLLL